MRNVIGIGGLGHKCMYCVYYVGHCLLSGVYLKYPAFQKLDVALIKCKGEGKRMLLSWARWKEIVPITGQQETS
jgi:hypothetical protein